MHIEVMSNASNKFLSPRQLLTKYSQNPTSKFKHFSSTFKHFQAPLSVLRLSKGLEFESVTFKQLLRTFKDAGEPWLQLLPITI